MTLFPRHSIPTPELANLLFRHKERTVFTMRNIFTVNATQVVVSENNPQGVLSNISGYPVPFDSRSYKATAENPNGDASIALLAARANYSNEIVTLATAENANRVAWTVSITRASDGKQIDLYSYGAFPDMTPPEPEPEGEEE
jgi:hypothetical protein